jgi:hemolysin activation/secretion protein
MKTHRSSSFIPVVLAGTALYFSANAAPPNVDAGSLLRQNEQDIKAPKPALKLQPAPHLPAPAASADEATVLVRAYKFAGNTLLSSEVLVQAVAPYVDRALSVAQLKEVADVVKNTYREAGWSVRAYLPKQEVNGGVVTIQIVEAVFGGASLSGAEPQRIEAARLVEMADASLGKGKPLHALQLDRTLLLLDDLPGVSVTGNLVQGERDAETNLVLAATDEAVVAGNAFIDNQGARTTGADRLSVNLNVNSPARLGDALGLNALKTQGVEYQRLSYSVPVGYDGWRAGLHASNLNYKIVADEFASLNPFGKATTRGWDASYPLVRSQLQNINFALSYDDKKFDNTSNGDLTSYGIKAYNASLNANLMDSWAGGGVTNAIVAMTRGDKNTDTRFTKLNLSLSRLQSLSDSLSVYVAASAQTSNVNLDSSEKMYLGGATGVRAYPSSEAGGSEGNTLTLELRQRIDNTLTLTGFYDYGRVKVNRDNSIASPANPNDYNLQGYGVTVAWQATQAIDFKATVAQRMGNNPAANTTTGMDGDGTKKITRIWLSSGITF